jgi:hypothetical protein
MTEKIKQLRKRQHLTTVLSFLLGFMGTCGIVFYGKTGTEISVYQSNFANSILYLALFYLLAKGWKIVFHTAGKRVSAAAAISGFIYAALLVLGAQLDYSSSIQWNYATAVKIILLAPVLQMLICLLFLYFERHKERILELNISAGKQKVFVYCVILAVWGITFLALFPGVYGYDAPYQIVQALGEMEVTTYQPVLHTFIMGKCVQIGHILSWYLFVSADGISCLCSDECMHVCIFANKKLFMASRDSSVFCAVSLTWCAGGIFYEGYHIYRYLCIDFYQGFEIDGESGRLL